MHKRAILTAALCLTACEKPDPPEIVAAKSVMPFLRDTEGVVFRLPPIQSPVSEGGEFYCGLINARNEYGGMTGFLTFSVFISSTEAGVVAEYYKAETPESTENAILAVRKLCEESGYSAQVLFEAEEWRPPGPDRD